jgi:hypothetical protein
VDKDALSALVRQHLAEGRLPGSAASQIRASFGDESACAVCEKCMSHDDVTYELRFAGADVQPLRMHLRCFLAWEEAIRK